MDDTEGKGRNQARGENGRSEIIEHVYGYAGHSGENRMDPLFLQVVLPSGANDAFCFYDRSGYVPTSEEFWELVAHGARFYELVSDERIEEYNRHQYDAWNQREENPPHYEKKKYNPKQGFVYVLEGGGHYKIGHAKDPSNRGAVLGTELPFPVEIICTIRSEDCRGLESKLHKRYAEQRLNGEWFELSPEDVADLKGLAS